MEKPEEINLSYLRNNEHFQFMTDADVLITIYSPEELGIGSVYPSFKNLLQAEALAMRVESGSIRSASIDWYDNGRDKTWSAIGLKVRANLLSPFEDEVESAKIIRRMLDKYGNMRQLSYNEETAAITNLVVDLQTQANESHLEKTGITRWVSTLKTENEQFQAVFNERNMELAGRESGDVRAIRLQINLVYEQIIEMIKASLVLGVAKPVVFAFISKFNEKANYYKTTFTSRTSRRKNIQEPKPEV